MKYDIKHAILFAYEQGLFTVEDKSSFGCTGIHCEFFGGLPNGFYAFDDADDYETKEEFLRDHSKWDIAASISKTIKAFIEDESFPEEAYCYLADVKSLCLNNQKEYYVEGIDEWMEKANNVVEKELANPSERS